MYCFKDVRFVSVLMFLGINSLFIMKYGLRFFPLHVVLTISLLYVLLVYGFIKLLSGRIGKVSSGIQLLVMIAGLVSLSVVQSQIDPYSIQVDRWSAIHNFIENMLHGAYPYAAQTHLGGYGSPFPVWQLFHIPFYLLGNVGLSFVLVTSLFIDSIRRLSNLSCAFLAFMLLMLSPAFYYEVLVRSDLMTNFLLCASIIMYFHHYGISFNRHPILLSVIIGLMASTRLSAVIPFIVYVFGDYIHAGYRKQIACLLVAFAVFAVTFVPFLLWNGEMLLFFEYNPFVLQSRQGNMLDFVLFVPLGIWMSLSWKDDIRKYMFNTACLLLFLVSVTFVHNMYLNNNWDELFQSAYDITYFDMAFPFLLMAIVHKPDE